MLIRKELLTEIVTIIADARQAAVRSVDTERVRMYWRIGEKIFAAEQRGQERAGNGEAIIKNLSENLEREYGSGFSYRQLELCRQF